jgi:thiazole synthase
MDSLVIAGRSFRSRLIVGTGKYKSGQETARAIEASGAEMVTVAVRRVNLDRSKESLLDFIDPKKYFLLPNTAGCYTADEAIRAARLAREVGLSDRRPCHPLSRRAGHRGSHSGAGKGRLYSSAVYL